MIFFVSWPNVLESIRDILKTVIEKSSLYIIQILQDTKTNLNTSDHRFFLYKKAILYLKYNYYNYKAILFVSENEFGISKLLLVNTESKHDDTL